MWGVFHEATSVVATLDDTVVGDITGFRVPDAPGRVFVWQIAVDEHQRGHGIGGRTPDDLVRRPGAEALHATVHPETTPADPLSQTLRVHTRNNVPENPLPAAHPRPAGHRPAVPPRFPILPPTQPHA